MATEMFMRSQLQMTKDRKHSSTTRTRSGQWVGLRRRRRAWRFERRVGARCGSGCDGGSWSAAVGRRATRGCRSGRRGAVDEACTMRRGVMKVEMKAVRGRRLTMCDVLILGSGGAGGVMAGVMWGFGEWVLWDWCLGCLESKWITGGKVMRWAVQWRAGRENG